MSAVHIEGGNGEQREEHARSARERTKRARERPCNVRSSLVTAEAGRWGCASTAGHRCTWVASTQHSRRKTWDTGPRSRRSISPNASADDSSERHLGPRNAL